MEGYANTRFRITTHSVERPPAAIDAMRFAGAIEKGVVFEADGPRPGWQAHCHIDDLIAFWPDRERQVKVPDELVIREFLALDADDNAQLVAFLAAYGPFWPPTTWTEDARDVDDRHHVDDASGGPGSARSHATIRHQTLGVDHQVHVGALVGSWYGEYSPSLWDRGVWSWCYVRASPDLGLVSPSDSDDRVMAFSLEPQRVHVKIRQALVESWLLLEPDDLLRERAHTPVRPELREAWERRACTSPLEFLEPDDADDWKPLMIPATTGELLRTMVQLLNQSLFEWSARVELDGFGGPVPRIEGALDLQLLAYLDLGVAARICAKEGCGRWFVHQRGRSRAGQQRDLGVKYCSASCARAAAQRAYRRRRARTAEEARGDKNDSH